MITLHFHIVFTSAVFSINMETKAIQTFSSVGSTEGLFSNSRYFFYKQALYTTSTFPQQLF